MELETVEKDGRLIVDMKQNHGLANLVRKAVWETEGEAAYDKGHPLGGDSSLIIDSDDPKKTLQEAIEVAKDWISELEDQV